jgi:hypothetical protein
MPALCHIALRCLEDDVRMLLPCLLLHMALSSSSSSSGLNFLSSSLPSVEVRGVYPFFDT